MSAVPEEVKAEDGKAEPEKKLFYCDVSGCLWGVFSPGSLWEPGLAARGALTWGE